MSVSSEAETESYSFIQMAHWASAFSRRGLREGGEEKNIKIKKVTISGGKWLQAGPMWPL